MTPPDDVASNVAAATARGRRRSYHACLTCRRKKTRCPGEKPACSSCVRLKQSCAYPPAPKPPRNGRSEERITHLEEILDRLLNGSLSTQSVTQEQLPIEDIADVSEKSFSLTPPAIEQAFPPIHPPLLLFDQESPQISSKRPAPAEIAVGVGLYFEFCHRQPIWCFEREDVSDYNNISEELASSILALAARFSRRRDRIDIHRDHARSLIMQRMATGMVHLTTIESICLLSYSFFMDGNTQMGQFHLGLAFQLCRSAMLDVETTYRLDDPTAERKKRLFWSLQALEQYFGRNTGILSIPTEAWRPSYTASGIDKMEVDPKAPSLPRDDIGYSGARTKAESGVWNTSLHLGWIWSRVRQYVSECSRNVLKEPWRRDSMYAMVLSDFMETENMTPVCHRYDTVKFYERKVDELKTNRDYWAPWLKEQFTYHAVHTVLNHPFLYIVGAQHNPNLAIPNTFWRRSSELALLHSTWIVRMIDMVLDKQIPLADPFFGHIAAIAATVHLYYCCAAATRLKHKSNTDFAKCRRFLKFFLPFSPACAALDRNLDKMARIAAGSESVDVEDWMPSRIYLSVPLMWDILQFNCNPSEGDEHPTGGGLLDASLNPTMAKEDRDESSTLEIVVATSPEIIINTADGGQDAPSLSYKGPGAAAKAKGNMATLPDPSKNTVCIEMSVAQTDSLAFNTTPWLYEDPSQFVNMGDVNYPDVQNDGNGTSRGLPWWEGAFSNAMQF